MTSKKKKENPFSFFSYVKEDGTTTTQEPNPVPTTANLNLDNDLPFFNSTNNTLKPAATSKAKLPVPNIFDDDDDDESEDEEDDDDDDDDETNNIRSKSESLSIKNNNKVSQQQQAIKKSTSSSSSTTGNKNIKLSTTPSSRLNSLFQEQQNIDNSNVSLEKLDHIPTLPIKQQQPSSLPINITPTANSINTITPNALHSSNEQQNTILNNLPSHLPPPLPSSTGIATGSSPLPPHTIVQSNSTTTTTTTTATTAEELIKLKQQIEQLQNENLKSKQMIKTLKERCVKYKGEKENLEVKLEQSNHSLEQFKIKEAKDNLIMEDVVAKVEENLNQTKKRAQQAESYVEQLKNEISQLKQQNFNNNPEIQELRFRLSDANDKGKMASSLMFQAANEADVNIKNLLRGVEQLKNISFLLNNLDKVTTLPP